MGHIHASSAGLGHRISAAAFGSALGYLRHCVGRCCDDPCFRFSMVHGMEVDSLVKTMSGARTDDVGVLRVMVPVEGVVLGLFHAQGCRLLDVTYRAPLMLHHLGLLTLQLP